MVKKVSIAEALIQVGIDETMANVFQDDLFIAMVKKFGDRGDTLTMTAKEIDDVAGDILSISVIPGQGFVLKVERNYIKPEGVQ